MSTAITTGAVAPCARCASPLEAGDLRCTICSLPTPIHGAHDAQAIAEVLRCRGCGAAIEYDVRVQAPRCAFCGSVVALERSEDPIEQAELFLPFRVDPATAQAALQHWLSTRGFFRPSDLSSQSTLQMMMPIWWVGWTFDADALVSWTADSDYGHGRSQWAPHAGQSPLSLRAVLVSASRGLSAKETHVLAPRFDLTTAQGAPHAMPGAVIERFDVQRSAARQIVSDAVKGASAAHARSWIPGARFRKLNVAVLLRRLTTRRFAFPSYVLAYRYADKLYRVVLHGQDPRCIVGDSPLSIWKILLVVLAALGLVGVLAGIVVLASLMDR
ncbi:MAG: zinc ribbon domain-containing protein [Sandaracinaceae bacterium]|nr:zinc ribbon domain-containing protein [Sandaracinaceae bacterium]